MNRLDPDPGPSTDLGLFTCSQTVMIGSLRNEKSIKMALTSMIFNKSGVKLD